jgi:hypothetical protein
MFGEMRILSDGKRVAFVWKNLKGIIVYYSEHCVPKSLSMNSYQSTAAVECMGGMKKMVISGPIQQNFTVDFEAFSEIVIGGEELLKSFMTVDSLSIEGLFKVIQDRVTERENL